ncbi:uncharacterized protein FA14DRAFT_76940 [Meira miltonrushii]|uniref:alpha-galactosidase n=1 Tax=Meira miltonrushii TaxID=1280837 RepID=A0A316V6N7_9BASI|nr:uncharacterized protein FA14DRAFT_76940 [Meira miltonrushii]PWN32698.1 hypothetical protein FA14DRAFT_76940 [Meira miltonrushii]
MSDIETHKASSLEEEGRVNYDHIAGKQKTSRRKYIFAGLGLLLLILIGLGIGLGVGLTHKNDDADDSGSSESSSDPSGPVLSNNSSTNSSIWQPAAGISWNYLLLSPPLTNATNGTQAIGLDLFDVQTEIVQGLQQNGAKVICYFSAGSYENWRPDQAQFQPDDLGKSLKGWKGERWLNVSSPNVHKIMEARMDLAVQKHCDAIDPDNVDGYDNDNGLGLTETDAINYLSFLSTSAHSRGLAIGLKNAGGIVDNVVDVFQFSVQEQCEQTKECEQYTPFITQNKPVFHVEYPKGDKTNNNADVSATQKQIICNDSTAKGFSTIMKNMNLDSWIESC